MADIMCLTYADLGRGRRLRLQLHSGDLKHSLILGVPMYDLKQGVTSLELRLQNLVDEL